MADAQRTVICRNRRARHDYHIDETYEAGIVLCGSEVKSLRLGKAQLVDGYARVKNRELWLLKVHISPYEQANLLNHEPERDRKLLMHKVEILRIEHKLRGQGLTLVPLEMYFEGSHAKVQLGLARGKRAYDKRQAIAKRESDRRLRGVLKQRGRRA